MGGNNLRGRCFLPLEKLQNDCLLPSHISGLCIQRMPCTRMFCVCYSLFKFVIAGKPFPKRVEALSQNTQVFLVYGEELGSALAKKITPLTACCQAYNDDGNCTADFQVALVLRVIYSIFPDAIINPLSSKALNSLIILKLKNIGIFFIMKC